MKMFIKKPMLLLFVITLSFMSCNNEELFVDDIVEVVEDTPIDPDNPPVEDTNSGTTDTSAPCDFTLDAVQSGDTVIINCLMDLGGAAVTLPSNVTILYEGGDIINGTLNFSDNNVISGELLNATLTLGGSTPQLKDTTFNFDPKRWGIVEGVVSDEVALNNRLIINDIFKSIKSLGVTTIKIDALDAYFAVVKNVVKQHENPEDAAIQVPSETQLIMTNNTHLRVQPNNEPKYALLTTFKADNAIVEGGNLYADRDSHDYSNGGTHEWGVLVLVKASKNVTIKNMTLMDATGDGIEINALGHAYDSYYTYCDNVLITDNKIIRARRNGLSLTDGRHITIENNEFIDSGVSTNKSEGTAPMWAIDIEPYSPNGTVYEIVQDITVKNNIEKGSEKGGFLIYAGDRITIENNTMENSIAYRQTAGSIIRNNNIVGVSDVSRTARDGIICEYKEGNQDNLVYGNTVINFNKGIIAGDYNGIEVYDNMISNCGKAIGYQSLINAKIYSNTITSCGLGIGSEGINVTLDNTKFYDNVINDCDMGGQFNGTNGSEKSNTFVVRNNILDGKKETIIKDVYGLEFDNNTLSGGLRIHNVQNSSFTNNTISGGDGIAIYPGNKDVNITNNTIIGKCFWDFNTDDYAAVNVVIENNTCK
jgi:hypothetical protein